MLRLTTLLMLSLLTVCPDQQWKDMTQAPFTIDVSRIAEDPASKEPGFLGWAVVPAGQECVWDANFCDPEGDPVVVEFSGIPGAVLTVDDPNIAVTFTPQPGKWYGTITATDAPIRDYTLPAVRKGTFVVYAVQPNKPPNIGCGGIR